MKSSSSMLSVAPPTVPSESSSRSRAKAYLAPRSFFLSDATHIMLEMAMRDCEFALIVNDMERFGLEFKSACRVLDNYSFLQTAGWYAVLDARFSNIAKKRGVYDALVAETESRRRLAQALTTTEPVEPEQLEPVFETWSEQVRAVVIKETKLFRPFEGRLTSEIGVKVLANGGNDWEFFMQRLFTSLESHQQMHELAAFVRQLQAALQRCTDVERERLLPVIEKTLQSETLQLLQGMGVELHSLPEPPVSEQPQRIVRSTSSRSMANLKATISSKSLSGKKLNAPLSPGPQSPPRSFGFKSPQKKHPW